MAETPAQIIILESSPLPQYAQAAEGFKRCLPPEAQKAAFIEVILNNEAKLQADLRTEGKGTFLFTLGPQASLFARKDLSFLPSVFAMVIEPTQRGLTKGGVSLDLSATAMISYIQDNFPQLKRVGIIFNPAQTKDIVNEFLKVKSGSIAIVPVKVPDISKIPSAIESLKTNADCLLIIVDPSLYTKTTIQHILLQCLQLNLPVIAPAPSLETGALAAAYPDIEDNGCQAGELAGRMMKGEALSSLPLLAPRKVASTVNLIIAKRLGLEVPAKTIQAAEKVIQ